jgi:HemY protein
MKSLFWLLVVFAAAVAFVLLGRSDAGHVLFIYPPYRVEMSMLLFGTATLAAFGLFYAVLRLLGQAFSIPEYVRAFRTRRRRDRAHAALASAMQAYFEGRYARAEKEAGVAYENGTSQGLAALVAARAAHQMRDFERRDRWLASAEQTGEGLQAARLVTRAELALDEHDFVAARDALRALHGTGPKHIATQRMLLRAERGTGDWDEVLRLSTQLAKRDAIAPALAEEYKVQATVELLQQAAADRTVFERRWRSIASRDQVEPRVAAAAARHASALGNATLAREIIEKALGSEWATQLVMLYGELPERLAGAERVAEARMRLERAEQWLLERERDAQLLATLGKLCVEAELWGKARSCLEASVSFGESRSAHLELARLAERLAQSAEAQHHYRRAAEIA